MSLYAEKSILVEYFVWFGENEWNRFVGSQRGKEDMLLSWTYYYETSFELTFLHCLALAAKVI